MNPLAQELNDILKGTTVSHLLSDFGKRFYFPKGIVTQSAEAKDRATRYNATVGMATLGADPIFLNHVKGLVPGLTAGEMFPYAPTPGVPALRQAWKEEMLRKNPSLQNTPISLPLVTTGLTHGVSTVADLFLDPGDQILVPDMFWGNYRLIFEGRNKAVLKTFPFFNHRGGMNLAALEEGLRALPLEKSALVLNFPNNPTGYTPTNTEMQDLVALLEKLAREGRKLLVLTDDAYFGLFYEEDTCRESLFSFIAGLHENIVAVKLDGATKEELAWGFRVGFITYGSRGLTDAQYAALDKKTGGAVRASISNSSKLSQSLVLRGLTDPGYRAAKDQAEAILKARYLKVREAVNGYGKEVPLKALPFNSGYFMTFLVEGKSAEDLRLHLLDNYAIGTISIQEKYLRVAYSSVDIENLEDLFSLIAKAAVEL